MALGPALRGFHGDSGTHLRWSAEPFNVHDHALVGFSGRNQPTEGKRKCRYRSARNVCAFPSTSAKSTPVDACVVGVPSGSASWCSTCLASAPPRTGAFEAQTSHRFPLCHDPRGWTPHLLRRRNQFLTPGYTRWDVYPDSYSYCDLRFNHNDPQHHSHLGGELTWRDSS